MTVVAPFGVDILSAADGGDLAVLGQNRIGIEDRAQIRRNGDIGADGFARRCGRT
jgi:hypothetical protein